MIFRRREYGSSLKENNGLVYSSTPLKLSSALDGPLSNLKRKTVYDPSLVPGINLYLFQNTGSTVLWFENGVCMNTCNNVIVDRHHSSRGTTTTSGCSLHQDSPSCCWLQHQIIVRARHAAHCNPKFHSVMNTLLQANSTSINKVAIKCHSHMVDGKQMVSNVNCSLTL